MAEPNAGEKVVSRGINPAMFLLALLLFLFLPSVAVSCDKPAGQPNGPYTVSATFTGTGIVLDEPTVHTSGTMARTPAWERAYEDRAVVMDWLARGLAIVTAILLLVGIVSAMIGAPRRRLLIATVVAWAATVLLVVTELVASSQLESAVRELMSVMTSEFKEAERSQILNGIGDAVTIGLGFWLALAELALVTVINTLLVFRRR